MSLRIALALALTGAALTAQAQTCNSNILASAPDSRYVVNAARGTVLDRQTGLTWKRCVEGQSGADCGAGKVTPMNWGAALRQAATSTFAGFKDWRVPNRKELESLVEVACYSPAINMNVFPNDPSIVVWASSPSAYYGAWYVGFNSGYSYHGNPNVSSVAVRLVRGGQ